MADTTTTVSPPVLAETAALTEDAFLADRQEFWTWWTGLVTTAAIGVAVLLVLLAIFLV